jgi:hypothetical protein
MVLLLPHSASHNETGPTMTATRVSRRFLLGPVGAAASPLAVGSRPAGAKQPEKMEDAMATVRIHRFRLYDITSDTYRISRRWATRDTIELLGGDIIESPAVEVDASVVGREIEGMTEIDFDPKKAA